jgi:DNA primase
MGIADEDVARVRAASDLVALASEHIALKKVGRRFVGLCPFHAEKTPSFSVNAEEGLWYCFGCQARGDVITFVREVEHLDFVGAVERLAARAGIELRYDDAVTTREHQRRTRLVDAMRRAVDWYHDRLVRGPDAGPARRYLRQRGYDRDVVEQFSLGWAPDEWDGLCRSLSLPDDVVRDTGLGFVNRRNRLQDSFRARLMFPIFDVKGDPVAFGGRVLPGGEAGQPKYKNSADTPIYSKSRVLYGLNWGKSEVVAAGEVIVCEGYTDVIAFTLAGLPRAVATCGTALADEHFRILKNFARRVVLAYDADAAGQAAAERFYEWEQRYEVDIAVAALRPGSDPADIARDDPAALKTAVEEARPFLAFRIDRQLAAADMRSPEGRARAAEGALAAIREHPSELVRDQYVMQVADRCRLDPDRLRAELASAGRVTADRRARDGRSPPPRVRTSEGPELEALRLAIHRPEALAGRLHDALFGDEVHAAAFRALAASSTLHEAIEAAEPEVAALLQRLAVEESEADPDDVVARTVEEAAKRVIAALERRARETDTLQADVGWLKLMIEQLREPATGIDAAKQLVPWLAARVEEH